MKKKGATYVDPSLAMNQVIQSLDSDLAKE